MNVITRLGRAIASAPGAALDHFRSGGEGLTGTWHRLGIALNHATQAGGVRVDETTMLSLAAAWACINAISTDIAFLPVTIMRKLPNGRRVVEDNDPRIGLLADSPDGARTPMAWRQALQARALGWGNGASEIIRDGDGTPIRLGPPAVATPYTRQDGSVGYHFQATGVRLPAYNVIHIAGLSLDGLNGLTPVQYHRETLGLSLASVRFGLSLFGNGSVPGGFLKTPKKLSKEAAQKLIAQFEKTHRGPDNAFRLALLEEGVTWERAAINPQDAQYLALRSFQIAEICRIYRVPLHKIVDYSQVQLASAGIEAMNLDYLATTLVPWIVRYEQEFMLKLFTPAERRAGLYVRFNVAALLRGDMKSRAEFYKIMVENGIYSRDEVRALEDMDAIGPDLGGDKFTVQSQFIDLAQVGKVQPSVPANPAK